MKMSHDNIRKLVVSALFLALSCVATIIVQVPSPMQGYLNLGDCFVLLGGWALGPFYGAAAGGIGSALADILTGYAYYAPGTAVIKALMALVAAILFKRFRSGKKIVLAAVISGIVAEVIMIAGYFLYAALLLGNGLAAALSIPGNALQGLFGIATSTALAWILCKNKLLDTLC